MNSLISVHCTAMQTRQQHCFLWQYSQPKAHLKLSANNLGEEDLMRPSDLFSSPPSAGIVSYTLPEWGGRTLKTPPQAIHKDGLDNHLLHCHYHHHPRLFPNTYLKPLLWACWLSHRSPNSYWPAFPSTFL